MLTRARFVMAGAALSAALLSLAPAPPAAAAGVVLTPHRAVYDLRLLRSRGSVLQFRVEAQAAAERRKTLAHGASHGFPRRGRYSPNRGVRTVPRQGQRSYAPPGLALIFAHVPRLAPWAKIFRHSVALDLGVHKSRVRRRPRECAFVRGGPFPYLVVQ